MIAYRALLLAVASLVSGGVAPGLLQAQDWRTVNMRRQLHDTAAVAVAVQLVAGHLDLVASDSPMLYELRARFQPHAAEVLHAWDAAQRKAELGLRRREGGDGGDAPDMGDSRAPEVSVELGRGVPIDLELELGAVQAELDLGGLRLTRVHLASGASELHVRFSAPNPVSLSSLEVRVGAAELTMERLADAHTGMIRVSSGLGAVDLDFGGTWRHDIALQLEVALGSVRLRVPRDVGVSVEHSRFLGRFDTAGLERRGDRWVTPNFDTAPYKLTVRARTAIGKLTLDRS